MKYTILAMAMMSNVAIADVCESYADLAETIMELRQRDVPADQLINTITNNVDDERAVSITKALVIDAYTDAAYNTEAYRNKAISQFRNKYYIGCLSSE